MKYTLIGQKAKKNAGYILEGSFIIEFDYILVGSNHMITHVTPSVHTANPIKSFSDDPQVPHCINFRNTGHHRGDMVGRPFLESKRGILSIKEF